ncbi:MAG: von Willebrand factor type A domain-containing protein [Bacteroidia bacterium]|nr:von Willebrand factor type A domain-containing protein [Bacteroidia bacterium]
MKRLGIIIALLGLLFISADSVQLITVQGTVKSADTGEGLAGATVIIKGTTKGTYTDFEGRYILKDVPEDAILIFRFIEMETHEEKVKGRNKINVNLKSDGIQLDEVVVTGATVGVNKVRIRKKRKNKSHKPAPTNSAPVQKMEMEETIALQEQLSELKNETEKLKYQLKQQEKAVGETAKIISSGEGYDEIVENNFRKVEETPLSTFSIDVDKASYANVRRFIHSNQMPPKNAVRIEEMINYFSYDFAEPKGEHPFNIITEMANCPWNDQHQLLQVALKGKEVSMEEAPASNLVFLVDVSGSMSSPNKLPLLIKGLELLVEQLRPEDRVALVVYAGSSGLVLPSTSGNNKRMIKDALKRLRAGGGTAGAAGIKLAYEVATENFIEGGNNRLILATDGDFNVGISSDDELVKMIEKEREAGVFLTVLGFGTGNYQDAKMEKLADKGNGNYAYIDNILEAQKVLVEEIGGTLFTIAKDVKIQIEFNPAKVQSYRLIGYENRILAKEDFNDDKKDAGELGAGHTVTALYEIIPAGLLDNSVARVDPLKYQQLQPAENNLSKEWLTVKFRYKHPEESKSKLIVKTFEGKAVDFKKASENLRFASSVAGFGMMLRDSKYKGDFNYDQIIQLAKGAKGVDDEGYRAEFISLVKKAKLMN